MATVNFATFTSAGSANGRCERCELFHSSPERGGMSGSPCLPGMAAARGASRTCSSCAAWWRGPACPRTQPSDGDPYFHYLRAKVMARWQPSPLRLLPAQWCLNARPVEALPWNETAERPTPFHMCPVCPVYPVNSGTRPRNRRPPPHVSGLSGLPRGGLAAAGRWRPACRRTVVPERAAATARTACGRARLQTLPTNLCGREMASATATEGLFWLSNKMCCVENSHPGESMK